MLGAVEALFTSPQEFHIVAVLVACRPTRFFRELAARYTKAILRGSAAARGIGVVAIIAGTILRDADLPNLVCGVVSVGLDTALAG